MIKRWRARRAEEKAFDRAFIGIDWGSEPDYTVTSRVTFGQRTTVEEDISILGDLIDARRIVQDRVTDHFRRETDRMMMGYYPDGRDISDLVDVEEPEQKKLNP